MNKLLLSSAVFCVLAGTSAFANDVSIGVNIGGGEPPSASLLIAQPQAVIVAPQPVVIERPDAYDPHHRRHDAEYWRRHKEEERRAHEHHDHDDHHDHY